jgi:glycosyltransferase involved in cell wall biosynthesis
MRVIQVNKFHFVKGGAERYYLDLAAALARRGHEVQHLAMAHPRNLAAGPGDRFAPEVDYRARMSLSGLVRQGARSIYNRQAAQLARQMAGAGDRPVAHLHNIYHQLSPSVIRAFAGAGVPMVQTLHDYKLVCPGYLLMTEGKVCERCRGGRFYQAVSHRCLLESRGASLLGAAEAYLHRLLDTYGGVARFLCPSQFMLEKVASFGVARERLVHLPYFLPLERYEAATQSAVRRAEGLDCVYIGRLSREKGIATLLAAVSRLPRATLRLNVLGEGPLQAELEAKVRAECPDSRIRFLGYQSGEQLHQTIRGCAFAVVPSEWYENLPFAVLEPFALGRPVVGARIGGIPELVRDGVTGRLFESGEAESLVEALLWMTGPNADLEGMGANARRLIEREHAEDPHVSRILSIYQEVAP